MALVVYLVVFSAGKSQLSIRRAVVGFLSFTKSAQKPTFFDADGRPVKSSDVSNTWLVTIGRLALLVLKRVNITLALYHFETQQSNTGTLC